MLSAFAAGGCRRLAEVRRSARVLHHLRDQSSDRCREPTPRKPATASSAQARSSRATAAPSAAASAASRQRTGAGGRSRVGRRSSTPRSSSFSSGPANGVANARAAKPSQQTAAASRLPAAPRKPQPSTSSRCHAATSATWPAPSKNIWAIAASASAPSTWPTTSCGPTSRWRSTCRRRSATKSARSADASSQPVTPVTDAAPNEAMPTKSATAMTLAALLANPQNRQTGDRAERNSRAP